MYVWSFFEPLLSLKWKIGVIIKANVREKFCVVKILGQLSWQF